MNVSCREVPASQAVTFVSKLSIRPQITTSPYYISLASPTPPTGSALPSRAQRTLHQRHQHENHPSLRPLLTTRKRHFVSYSCSGAYEGGKVTSTGHSSDQYWSQCEAVLVDICYQYWSLRRPVLVRIPPLLFLSRQLYAIAIPMIDTACATTLPQGDKSTYIGSHHPLPQDGILPSRSSPAALPAERANFDSEAAPSLVYL